MESLTKGKKVKWKYLNICKYFKVILKRRKSENIKD